MIASKTRNYSLKTFYQPKTERKQEEEAVFPKAKLAKLLPTIAENRDLQKTQAKELGISIKKFQNMISQKGSDINGEEMVRAAYFVIKNFGDVENNFKDVFMDLHSKLKDFLFMSDSEISFKYKLKEGVTYRKTCKIMERINNDWLEKKNVKITELEELILLKEQNGKNEAERLRIECFRLKEEVEKYKKIANVEYVRSLEQKVESLKETISSQEEDYKVLAKKNEESSLQIEQLRREVNELQVNCAIYEQKVYDLSVVREKTELYLLKTKDRFDELKNRLQSMKEVISKVEKENEILVAERSKLVNRAAVSFEDLTPRPQYGDYYLIDNNTYLHPTRHIFKALIQSYQGQKVEMFQKYFLSKKNRKLLQIQAIREKTVKELLQVKAQINKIH